MSFYSNLAEHYQTVFPFRPEVGSFLNDKLPARGPLLDLGCGTGAYCGHLHGPERPCYGVDLNDPMIKQARLDHPGPEFHVLGIDEVAHFPEAHFAGAFSLGNVLAHVDDRGVEDVLVQLWHVLAPGAVWIIQLVNFDRLRGCRGHTFPAKVFPEQALHFERRYELQEDGSYLFHTRLSQRGELLYRGCTQLHFHFTEFLLDVHQQVGFQLVEQLGDFADVLFQAGSSPANVLIFRKPA
jgi:SAM-dependent methyltransferase